MYTLIPAMSRSLAKQRTIFGVFSSILDKLHVAGGSPAVAGGAQTGGGHAPCRMDACHDELGELESDAQAAWMGGGSEGEFAVPDLFSGERKQRCSLFLITSPSPRTTCIGYFAKRLVQPTARIPSDAIFGSPWCPLTGKCSYVGVAIRRFFLLQIFPFVLTSDGEEAFSNSEDVADASAVLGQRSFRKFFGSGEPFLFLGSLWDLLDLGLGELAFGGFDRSDFSTVCFRVFQMRVALMTLLLCARQTLYPWALILRMQDRMRVVFLGPILEVFFFVAGVRLKHHVPLLRFHLLSTMTYMSPVGWLDLAALSLMTPIPRLSDTLIMSHTLT